MIATVMYSKIVDSQLPSEIQGENGTITIDRINFINHAEIQFRNAGRSIITTPVIHNEYYYELKEFIDLVYAGKRESAINSHQNSLTTLEIIDEIRRQLHIVYPADTPQDT